MKKLVKAMSILAALAMLGSAFISCSDGGSSGGSGGEPETPETPETPGTPENPGGGDPENTSELVATVVWNVTEYAALVGSDSATSYTEDKTYGNVTAIQPFSLRNATVATKYTVKDENDLSCTGYLQIAADGTTTKKALKFTAPAGTKKIGVVAKNGSSKNPANITISDGTNELYSFAPTTTYSILSKEVDITADTDVYVYNAEAAGQGGLNVQAIIIWKEAKVNPAPAATNFTPSSTAEGYSITVTDPTGIEYSTDNGTTWNDATATITLDTYGKVLFRTKATDDAGASSTVEVTVEEYVDTSKPQADKPSADNFAVVKSANGNDGSITLTSATGIEYKNGDVWEDAQASYKGLAAGTYSFRTKETNEKRASEALEVAVEAFVLPETYVANEWNFENADNFKFSGIAVKGSTNACELATTAEKGYLGRKLTTVEGLYVEFAGTGKGLGYANVEHDSGTRPTVFVPAIASTEALQGPFKVEVVLGNASATRTVKLFVSATKDDLFADASVVKSEALNSQTVSYIYTGTDAKFIGFGTLPDQTEGSNLGKVYTNIKSVKVTCAEEIPAETYAATAVAFSNEGIVSNNEITISKKQAEDNFQLTTTLTPSYTTDSVTFTKVSGDADISVSEDGKVSVAADYSKNAAVVVKATAGSVEATLTVNVNAIIPLTADTVVTISADKTTAKPSTDVTFTAALSKDVTEEISYEWSVDGTVQTETTKTFKFNTTTEKTYSITCKAKKDSVETAASEAVSVKISSDYTEYFLVKSDGTNVVASDTALTSDIAMASGVTVKVGTATDVKIKAQDNTNQDAFKTEGFDGAKNYIIVSKKGASTIDIPVKGNCIIKVGFNTANNAVRDLTATVASGTIKVVGASGDAGTTATYTPAAGNTFYVVPLEYNGTNGTVTLKTVNTGGAVRVYFIDVKHTAN